MEVLEPAAAAVEELLTVVMWGFATGPRFEDLVVVGMDGVRDLMVST